MLPPGRLIGNQSGPRDHEERSSCPNEVMLVVFVSTKTSFPCCSETYALNEPTNVAPVPEGISSRNYSSATGKRVPTLHLPGSGIRWIREILSSIPENRPMWPCLPATNFPHTHANLLSESLKRSRSSGRNRRNRAL